MKRVKDELLRELWMAFLVVVVVLIFVLAVFSDERLTGVLVAIGGA